MIKFIMLLLTGVVFMYLAYAASHYLTGFWFKDPTVIFMMVITLIHMALILIHTLSMFLPKKTNED